MTAAMEAAAAQPVVPSCDVPGSQTGSSAGSSRRSTLPAKSASSANGLKPEQQAAVNAAISARMRAWRVCMVTAATLAGFLVVLPWVMSPAPWPKYNIFSPDCLLPLGGGASLPGGSFQHLNSTRCQGQLLDYLAPGGPYESEVQHVADAAHAYMDALAVSVPPSSDQVFVFDIDETALSNMEEWMPRSVLLDHTPSSSASQHPWINRLQHLLHRSALQVEEGVGRSEIRPQQLEASITQTAGGEQQGAVAAAAEAESDSQGSVVGSLGRKHPKHKSGPKKPHGSKRSRHNTETPATHSATSTLPKALRDDGVDSRPALEPVKALYLSLLQRGYSVAFVTGRKEWGREATQANLLAAGYGSQCTTSKGESEAATVTAPVTAVTEAAGAAVLEQESAQDRSYDSKHNTVAPCYVALYMRDLADDRPASVYKPEKRQALLDMGYTLVGNIGDQFSDLDGLYQAESSWHLPNVMYYIL